MIDLIKKIRDLSDEKLNNLISELADNEILIKAVEQIFSTKEFMDRQTEIVLNSMNIASNLQTSELSDRLEQQERQIRKLGRQIDDQKAEISALSKKLHELEDAERKVAEKAVEPKKLEPVDFGEGECIVCGKTFKRNSFNHKYCSDECREKPR